jgi:hypothetical protein
VLNKNDVVIVLVRTVLYLYEYCTCTIARQRDPFLLHKPPLFDVASDVELYVRVPKILWLGVLLYGVLVSTLLRVRVSV